MTVLCCSNGIEDGDSERDEQNRIESDPCTVGISGLAQVNGFNAHGAYPHVNPHPLVHPFKELLCCECTSEARIFLYPALPHFVLTFSHAPLIPHHCQLSLTGLVALDRFFLCTCYPIVNPRANRRFNCLLIPTVFFTAHSLHPAHPSRFLLSFYVRLFSSATFFIPNVLNTLLPVHSTTSLIYRSPYFDFYVCHLPS